MIVEPQWAECVNLYSKF